MRQILATLTALLACATLHAGGGETSPMPPAPAPPPIRAAIIFSYTGFYNNLDACGFMAGALIGEGIDAAIVTYSHVDTMAELLAYDVFIFGSCGHYIDDNDSGYGLIQDEVRSFVEDHGRGVVGVGGVVYTCSSNRYVDYDAILPVNVHVPEGYHWGYDVAIVPPPHPLTTGSGGFGLKGRDLAEWPLGGAKAGALVPGRYVQNGGEAIACWTTGTARGRAAFLGPYYLADADTFNTIRLYQEPEAVRLLVNAVRWASSRLTLSAESLNAGQPAALTVVNAEPGDRVLFAVSAAGGGPHPSPWGNLLLTPPISVLSSVVADQAGLAVHGGTCPAMPGLTLWFQALDLEAVILSNGREETVR